MSIVNSRPLIALLSALAVSMASPSFAQSSGQAQSVSEGSIVVASLEYQNVISNLQSEGYKIIKVSRTLLGRIRIVARNGDHTREVVVSRTTGEIKRDVVRAIAGSGGSGSGVSGSATANASAGASGSVSDAAQSASDSVSDAVDSASDAVSDAAGGLGL